MNAKANPSFSEGFVPGMIRANGDNTTTRNEVFDLPGNREAMVAIRTGEMQPEDKRAEQREEFLLTVHPPSLTEGLEKEIARLTEQFTAFTHYDKEGNPVYRFNGREREVLEMKLANRRNALALAQRERLSAERFQAQHKAAKQASEQRIAAAADAKAQELIEQAEIDRRAKQIAARAGVDSK
jgi:hypothetical protein